VTVVGRRVRDTIAAQWASPGRHEVRVQSFNEAFIRAFARSYPEVRVSTVGLASPSAVAAYADDMQVHHANVTRALVDDAHRHGLLLGAWTVDRAATMRAIAGLGVDSITTDYPGRLRTTLAAAGLTYTGTQWPPPVARTPTWRLSTSGRFLNTPVRVRATLTTNGTPARWQWGAVQRRRSGRWQTLHSRATDSTGSFAATIPGYRGLRLRVISLDDWQYPLASSAPPRCRAGKDGEHPQALRPGLDPSRKRSLADDPVALRRPSGDQWTRSRVPAPGGRRLAVPP
jgi:hypothetical protein